jgi:nicotinamide phosphoribosyltransferase
MFQPNFQLLTDSYKVSHWKQLRPGTTNIYSYLESRGGMFEETLFSGLLPKLHLLQNAIYTSRYVHAERVWNAHFRNSSIYNKQGWFDLSALGYLPLRIKAVPEGTVVPTHNVLMTVENTHPGFAWLTNWAESLLLQTWYPITVGTISREIKKVIASYLMKTVGNIDGIEYMLHDFGFRGVSSIESAAIGGAAHLINFFGTDTAVAIEFIERYYGMLTTDKWCAGYSVPAAEHSTITSWGREHEADAYDNMLQQFPDSIVAVVSDSYDIYEACRNIWGEKLRAHVLGRNGTVVIRPDSGYPAEVVCKCLDILGEKFGFTKTEKGYKVLNPKVRLIQGDGVDYWSIGEILARMTANSWAANNVAFGMGGALLQKLNRDTQKMALKCSETTCNGVVTQVSKDPITDPGKSSKAGRLSLIKQHGSLITVPGDHKDDVLQTVFENGKILVKSTLADIRERARI